MMKKILNEWKQYVIKEANQPLIDEELGADFDGKWFGTFNFWLGLIQDKSTENKKWQDHLRQNFPKLKSNIVSKAPSQKEAERAIKKITGGHSYYVDKFLGQEAAEALIVIKVNGYVENAPKDQVEFFLANMERILEYAGQSMSNHSIAPTLVGFKARPTDWWMFGGGFELTKQVFTSVKANYEELGSLPGATEPEEPEAATPEQTVNHEKAMERTSGMADFFSRFYDQNPEALKQKRPSRSRK
jgi:hypothetical protein